MVIIFSPLLCDSAPPQNSSFTSILEMIDKLKCSDLRPEGGVCDQFELTELADLERDDRLRSFFFSLASLAR